MSNNNEEMQRLLAERAKIAQNLNNLNQDAEVNPSVGSNVNASETGVFDNNQVADAYDNITTDIADKGYAQFAKDSASNLLDAFTNSNLVQGAKGAVEQFTDMDNRVENISNIAEQASQGASDLASDTVDTVSGVAKNIRDNAGNYLVDSVEKGVDYVSNNNVTEDIKTGTENLVKEGIEGIASGTMDALETASKYGGRYIGALTDATSDVAFGENNQSVRNQQADKEYLANKKLAQENTNKINDEMAYNQWVSEQEANSSNLSEEKRAKLNTSRKQYEMQNSAKTKILKAEYFSDEDIQIINTSPEEYKTRLEAEGYDQDYINNALVRQGKLISESNFAIEQNNNRKTKTPVDDNYLTKNVVGNTLVSAADVFAGALGGALNIPNAAIIAKELKDLTSTDAEMYNDIKATIARGQELDSYQKDWLNSVDNNGVNINSRFQKAEQAIYSANVVAQDFSLKDYVYEGNQQALVSSVSDAFKEYKETGDLSDLVVNTASGLANNTSGLTEIVGTSMAEGIALASGLGISGRFTEQYLETFETFVEKNGRLPNDQERSQMVSHNVMATGLEKLGGERLVGDASRAFKGVFGLNSKEVSKAALKKITDNTETKKQALKTQRQIAKKEKEIIAKQNKAAREQTELDLQEQVNTPNLKSDAILTRGSNTPEVKPEPKAVKTDTDVETKVDADNVTPETKTKRQIAKDAIAKGVKASIDNAPKALKTAFNTLKGAAKSASPEALEELTTEYLRKKATMGVDETFTEEEESDLFTSFVLGGAAGGIVNVAGNVGDAVDTARTNKINQQEVNAEQTQDDITKASINTETEATTELDVNNLDSEGSKLEGVYKEAYENDEAALPKRGEEGFDARNNILVKLSRIEDQTYSREERIDMANDLRSIADDIATDEVALNEIATQRDAAIDANDTELATELGNQYDSMAESINNEKAAYTAAMDRAREILTPAKDDIEVATEESTDAVVEEEVLSREETEDERAARLSREQKRAITAKDIYGSIARNPDSVSAKDAEDVLNTEKEFLSNEQVEILNDHIKRVNTLNSVNDDVRLGRGKFKGLKSYLARANKAINSGNVDNAIKELNELKSWRGYHEAKLMKPFNGGSHTSEFINTINSEVAAMDSTMEIMANAINRANPNAEVNAETKVEDILTPQVNEVISQSDTAKLQEFKQTRLDKINSYKKKSEANTVLEESDKIDVLNNEEVVQTLAEIQAIDNELSSREGGLTSEATPISELSVNEAETEDLSSVDEVELKDRVKTIDSKRNEINNQIKEIENDISKMVDTNSIEKANEKISTLKEEKTSLTNDRNDLINAIKESRKTTGEKVAVDEVEDRTLLNQNDSVETKLIDGLNETNNTTEENQEITDIVITGLQQGNTSEAILNTLSESYSDATVEAVRESLKVPSNVATLSSVLTKPTQAELQVNNKTIQEAYNKANGDVKAMRDFHRGYNWVKRFMLKGNGRNIIQSIPNTFKGDIADVFNKITSFTGKPMTEADTLLADAYLDFSNKATPVIEALDITANNGMNFRDKFPVRYLTDSEGNLNPDVAEAISLGLFNYLATKGNQSLNKSIDEMRKAMYAREDATLNDWVIDALKDSGVARDLTNEDIGREIYKTLNLKPRNDMPSGFEQNLINSLGEMAVSAAIKMDLMEEVKIPKEVQGALNKERERLSEGSNNTYVSEDVYNQDGELTTAKGWTDAVRIKSVKNENGRSIPTEEISNIITSLKESNKSNNTNDINFWDSLTKGERSTYEPTFAPVETAPKTQKKTTQKTTKAERDAVLNQQKKKHFVRSELTNLFLALPKEDALKIFGKKNPELVPIANRATQETMNNSYERHYDELNDFVSGLNGKEEGINTPFFYAHDIWKNRRYGISQNVMNIQGNKNHRAFVRMDSWAADIDMNNAKLMDTFWKAMEEEVGIDNEADFLKNEVLVNAVNAIIELQENTELSEAQIKELSSSIVEAANGSAMKLDGLVQISRQVKAKRDGAVSFYTDLAVEVDGKTNGVIFSIIQYADAETSNELLAKLAKGGVYAANTIKNLREFGLSGGLDSYQEISSDWNIVLNNIANNFAQGTKGFNKLKSSQKIFGLIDRMDGDFNQKIFRKLSKQPLMFMNYGSGAANVSEGIVSTFFENVNDDIESILTSGKGTGLELLTLRNHLRNVSEDSKLWDKEITDSKSFRNANFEVVNGKVIDTNTGKDYTRLMDLSFNNVQSKNISDYINETYGQEVAKVVSNRYAKLVENRNKFNAAANELFVKYDTLRNLLLDKARKELTEKGIVVDSVKDLPMYKVKEIEEQLVGVMPSLKAPSAASYEGASYNTSLMKSGVSKPTSNVNAYTIDSSLTGTNKKQVANVMSPDAPGAGGGPLSIHQVDAFDILKTYESNLDTLGVHDANYWGINNIEEGANIQNETFFEINKNYRVMEELVNQIESAQSLIESITSTENLDIKEVNKDGSQSYVELNNAVIESKPIIDGALTDVRYVDQYSTNIDGTEAQIVESEVSNRDDIQSDLSSATKESLNDTKEDAVTDIQAEANTMRTFVEELLSSVNNDNVLNRYFDVIEVNDNPISEDLTNQEVLIEIVKENGIPNNLNTRDKNLLRGLISDVKIHNKQFNKDFNKSLVNESYDLFGSSSTTASIDPIDYDISQQVDATDTLSTFHSLPHTGKIENETHLNVLRDRVEQIASNLTKPFMLHMRASDNEFNYGVASNSDLFITRLREGNTVTSSMLAQGVNMSNQEVFAHELNHLVFAEGFKISKPAADSIYRMYQATKEQITVKDMLEDYDNATEQAKEGAEKTYNHIFNNPEGHNLEEFAAFGTTNEQFIKALNNVKVKPETLFSKEKTAYENMVAIFGWIVDLFGGALNRTNDIKNDEKLFRFLDSMIEVNQKKQNNILAYAAETANLTGNALNVVDKPLNGITKMIANSDAVKNIASNTGTGNAVKEVSSLLAKSFISYSDGAKGSVLTTSINETLDILRDSIGDQRQTVLSYLVDEMIGRTSFNAEMRDLSRKSSQLIDATRKRVKTGFTNRVRDGFLTEVSNEGFVAMNKVLLKTDIQAISNLGLDKVYSLVSNNQELLNEIAKLENEVKSMKYGNFYLRQSKGLGQYMSNGKVTESMQLLNSHAIANLYGDANTQVLPREAELAKPAIDKLVTLYALANTDVVNRNQVAGIIRREMEANSVDNGITQMIAIHKNLVLNSVKDFNSEAEYNALHVKGYTKEDYKEGIGFVAGGVKDHDALIAQGYIRGDKLNRDPKDPSLETEDNTRWMYYAPDGTLAPMMAGIVSLNSNRAKGTNTYQLAEQLNDSTPYQTSTANVEKINKEKQADINAMHKSSVNTNTGKTNYMVPVINPNGDIVDWRYLMDESTKDNLLGKENDASVVLGSMAASIVSKQNSKDINKEFVELSKKLFDERGHRRESAFVLVGPESTDPELKEIYTMLPKDVKDEIKRVWGEEGMMIRNDLLDTAFGYRKSSVTSIFEKEPEARNYFEKAVVELATGLMGDKAAQNLRKSQNVLEGVVQEVKDIIVVKSVLVTAMNMLSNTVMLKMQGLSTVDSFKLQYEGLTKGNALIQDMKKRDSLEIELASTNNPNKARKIQSELALVNRRIQANPVLETYQAGLMPNIVDDIASDLETNTNVRSKVQRKLSSAIDNNLNKTGATVAKSLLLLPDSEVYGALNNLVMMSDFMARHAALKNNVKEETLAKRSDLDDSNATLNAKELNEIIGEVEELFVNFNMPTHRKVQMLNDIGLAWFTKYNLRVLRSIARTLASKPKEVVKVFMFDEIFNTTLIDDSTLPSAGGVPLFENLDNPVSRGLGALELLPIVNLSN